MAPDFPASTTTPNKAVDSPVAWREASLDARFVVYTGTSMFPTLQEPEVIEISPYDNRAPVTGDVVLFLPPGQDQPIVHRVVEVTARGILTRGDNNAHVDVWVLQPEDIAGQVVAAWRAQERRRIMGGRAGQWLGLWLRLRRVLGQRVTRWLRLPYYALARRAILARWLPKRYRPRVVAFQVRGSDQWRLVFGQRVIGQYDRALDRWIVRRPFRLFVDEKTLATVKPSAPSTISSSDRNS